MDKPQFSIVIPVYNRPQEVDELLESLTHQTYKNFEVIIIEDGSTLCCDSIVNNYQTRLNIRYFLKPNSGPGPARNEGFKLANGNYFVIFDSDCIIPPHYFESVNKTISESSPDAWGGPDKAHENFTILQRAMGYTMSSILTTGGIRGGKKRVGWFQPRSFNMGISRHVFAQTGGFKFDRFAEDIEFSIRMKDSGFKVMLIPDAYVYHKRRTTFGQFFKQVSNFGKGRVLVGKLYPQEVKLTHWFPSVFTMGVMVMLILPFINQTLALLAFIFFGVYLSAIFLHSFMVNKNFIVAALSVPSALLQLIGYGTGFLKEKFKS